MNPYLFPSLPTGPKAIMKIMRRIPASAIDAPTHPGRFSPREVIAHLADWEPIMLQRMKQTSSAPGSTIIGIDEGVRAAEMNYPSLDWEEELIKWVDLREQTIQWLRGLEAEDWGKVVVHNERGPMSLADQANLLLGHDLYHIDQLMDVFP